MELNGIPEGIFGGGTKDKLLVYHVTFAIDRICAMRFAASWLTTPVSSQPGGAFNIKLVRLGRRRVSFNKVSLWCQENEWYLSVANS